MVHCTSWLFVHAPPSPAIFTCGAGHSWVWDISVDDQGRRVPVLIRTDIKRSLKGFT